MFSFGKICAGATLILWCAGAASAQSVLDPNKSNEKITLRTAEVTALGTYLTNQDGRAVYIFTADKNGKPTCEGPCAKNWAPLTTSSQTRAGDGVDAEKIGSVPRAEGRQQVTYAGRPLYYFINDAGATRATAGQAAQSHNGMWYLLAPNGEPIVAKRPGEFPNPEKLGR